MESVLIVDDDLDLCTVLSEDLKEIGYDTSFVTAADKALDFVIENPDTDLILLDLKMPGKDGLQFLRELRDKQFETKVIVLTAYADVRSAIDSARYGASDFISKPYDLDELIITMRRVLQKEEHEN